MRPEFYALTRLGQRVRDIETSAKRNYFIVNKIVNAKNDVSTVIFKLKSKIFACAQIYTIDDKNANETLTKTLHRNNTKKLRHE